MPSLQAAGLKGLLKHHPTKLARTHVPLHVLGPQISGRTPKAQCFRGIASESWRDNAHRGYGGKGGLGGSGAPQLRRLGAPDGPTAAIPAFRGAGSQEEPRRQHPGTPEPRDAGFLTLAGALACLPESGRQLQLLMHTG